MQAKDIKVDKEYAVETREGPARLRVTELVKPTPSYYGGRGKTKVIGLRLDRKTGKPMAAPDGTLVTISTYSDSIRTEWATAVAEIEERERKEANDRRAREHNEARLQAVATAFGVTREDYDHEGRGVSYWDRKLTLSVAVEEKRCTISFNLPFAEELIRRLFAPTDEEAQVWAVEP